MAAETPDMESGPWHFDDQLALRIKANAKRIEGVYTSGQPFTSFCRS